jgi:hypothetical protein
MMVIMMARTPSENASNLDLFMPLLSVYKTRHSVQKSKKSSQPNSGH